MSDGSVAQRIRDLILDGTLPPGTRVAEAAIAERLGVSRTPVRNVIPALATEGLLEPVGRRGYAVRSFSIDDSFRATELRCVLEGYAAHRIADRGATKQVVADLRDCLVESDALFAKGHFADGDQEAYARINRRFHDIIVQGAGDPLLADLIHRVYAVPFVAPDVVAFSPIAREDIFPILNSGQRQHHAIVDAIEAGQADIAEALMRGHSGPARQSLGVDQQPADLASAA
ncbi:GntR family transcriptional regulator [Sphingomonas sp.]|uniref:GntR family transcriptional regulator n=1 Tax=Sphingomonas sp. TaxID=28214 RepID=UPI00286C2A51|nr:GntR family transcriptional regulator [Sphingomonas sp.]